MMPIIDWPSTATNTAASAMPGIDMTMSISRMMISETHARLTAAIAPMIEPRTSANAIDDKPMTSEYRAPKMTRVSTSRPRLSVPNRWAPVGV